MIKFPAQLHNFRKVVLGDNIISFSVDRMYSDNIVEVIKNEIGTEFIVYLENVTSETSLNADNIELREKFGRKLHALLKDLASVKKCKPEEVKTVLKQYLKDKKLIKESTTELDLKGLAIACNWTETEIKIHGN